jgi:acetoin utilization deacetylase AcuC-like enzyme
MKVIFSRRQLLHDPPFEMYRTRKQRCLCGASRIVAIHDALAAEPKRFKFCQPRSLPESVLSNVHLPEMVRYLRDASRSLRRGEVIIPSVFFPSRRAIASAEMRRDLSPFCFDTTTPITRGTYEAAYWAVCCAATAAELLEQGERAVFALTHPPGHHAARDQFGGYCYFNNAAFAAARLLKRRKVAILDIDRHHGNGTQAIFYRRSRLLFVSLHGDPTVTFPYVSGYSSERGSGLGRGFNMNIPLPLRTTIRGYLEALHGALRCIKHFAPRALIVSAGFDIFKDDPEGGFRIGAEDVRHIAKAVRSLDLPTLIVLEGGYAVEHLGAMVQSLLSVFTQEPS